jgi:hypothetical protein
VLEQLFVHLGESWSLEVTSLSVFLSEQAHVAFRLFVERRRSSHQLEGEAAEGPDVVREAAVSLATEVLRRHPKVAVVIGELGVNIFIQDVQRVGEVVVAELDVAFAAVEDVGGLEVAAQRRLLGFDVHLVEVVDRDDDVGEDLDGEGFVVEI